ncbi:hypothetical protein LTR20_009396 [Exophiala xenobiotica]|nr:hypothetical protein LTR41_000855 [Exophiala xenobiotica]KAK5361816.1 hypothetical protein LTS13_009817 [Exophiala xenobiotica]KAK5393234.1 hypothetical protein LTR79_009548 [Exophiala xenobiotica]KAK5408134.1 hypothetical protein LTR90_009590 [Exophiala xenobiotica]KAK5456455.1 hypothetical protein LTR20_009396 [Exophiala xenobiotica]
MKPSQVLMFATSLIVGSAAQSNLLDQLPQCAVNCFQQTITMSSCSPSDIACLCGDGAFLQAASGCQAVNCTVKETLTSTNATLAACGVPPNDVSTTVLAIPAAFGTLSILMVIFRIADRQWNSKMLLNWDDYFVIAAVILAAPLNWVCIPMAHYGMGKDFWNIPFPNIDKTLQLLWIAEIFYMAAEAFVQLSLLAFYLRVFSSRTFRFVVFTLMGISVGFGIANTFAMIFQCTPIPFFWQGWAGETTGTCININLFSWIRAAVEIGLDIAVLSLPIPMLLKLDMSWRKKIQVIMMFSVGFVITIISILRLRSLIQFAKTTNPTFDNSPAVYWSVLECDMFIICCCMPSTRNLLKRIFPTCFGSTAADSHDPYPNSHSTGSTAGPKKIQLQYREGRTSHVPPEAAAPGISSHSHSHGASTGTGTAKMADFDFDADAYSVGRSESGVELVEAKRHPKAVV